MSILVSSFFISLFSHLLLSWFLSLCSYYSLYFTNEFLFSIFSNRKISHNHHSIVCIISSHFAWPPSDLINPYVYPSINQLWHFDHLFIFSIKNSKLVKSFILILNFLQLLASLVFYQSKKNFFHHNFAWSHSIRLFILQESFGDSHFLFLNQLKIFHLIQNQIQICWKWVFEYAYCRKIYI